MGRKKGFLEIQNDKRYSKENRTASTIAYLIIVIVVILIFVKWNWG